MSGEACGPWCQWCGRCDVDYAVRCATPGCENAVTFPDMEAFCSPCLQEHERRRVKQEQDRRDLLRKGAA